MSLFTKTTIAALFLLFLASCGSRPIEEETPAPPPAAEDNQEAEKAAEEQAAEPALPHAEEEQVSHHPYDKDWGYSENDGPDKWSEISEDYKLCADGKLQSPIDLKWTKPQSNTRKIEFDYKDVPLQVLDNGHTISVRFPPGSKGYFGGKQFQLENLHFHTSSEHTLSGNQLPMEAHLVHKNELGQIAVVGLFLIEGRFNPFIEKIWTHIPKQKHSERLVPNLMINAKDILPNKLTYYFYVGSLTTPPCTEGVRWQVLNTPVEVSREQIIQFRKLYKHNSRPVQPLKARNVINY